MSNDTELTASQKRAAHPHFVTTFSIEALKDRLPFRFPVPKGVSPSPKRHYRSHYRYLGYDGLLVPTILATLTLFEVALYLIDFSPLRDYLAQFYYLQTAKGQVPFDPVSLFLCLCLRRELNLSWRALALLLAGEHGAGWRRLFGFQEGVTPSASGLRYFFLQVGAEVFAELCPLTTDLLHQAGLLPEPSTSPQRGVTISHDLMLHEARSNMKYAHVTDIGRPLPWTPRPATSTMRAATRRPTYSLTMTPRVVMSTATPPTLTASLTMTSPVPGPSAPTSMRPMWTSESSSPTASPTSGLASLTSPSARCWPTPPWVFNAAWTPSGRQEPCA